MKGSITGDKIADYNNVGKWNKPPITLPKLENSQRLIACDKKYWLRQGAKMNFETDKQL